MADWEIFNPTAKRDISHSRRGRSQALTISMLYKKKKISREKTFSALSVLLQLDVLFGNLPEMVEFQVEFLKTLEDGTRLVPDLEKLERVDQFKVQYFNTRTIHSPRPAALQVR